MPKILILDDVSSYLDALSRALSFEYEIVKATNIEEAKNNSNETIDIFLVDICLDKNRPGIDRTGIEFLQWVREKFKDKPVIVMSAYRDYDAAVEALNLGAFKYLKKPIDLTELKSTLKEAILNVK
ncbi:MAG: response regulator [candidate division WOR-3 bacterium]|nr:response regulator [candidate division WOR-3 bacterium]